MNIRILDTVHVETFNRVAEITLNRPKSLNSINMRMLLELEQVLEALRKVDDLSGVIITGGDRAFVAGADIAELMTMSAPDIAEFARSGHRLLDDLEAFPVPVLAAVNGFALGAGCELALACDLVYASDAAKFGLPEVKLGLIPGFGGCVRLPRKLGYAAAVEWILTGEIYNAQVAKDAGLVREVVSPEELLPRVREVAKTIAERAPLAVRAAKRVMIEGMRSGQAAASAVEQLSFAQLSGTKDAREGEEAFLDKRDPMFSGT